MYEKADLHFSGLLSLKQTARFLVMRIIRDHASNRYGGHLMITNGIFCLFLYIMGIQLLR